MKKDLTELVSIGAYAKSEDNPSEKNSNNELKAAFINLKATVGGAKVAIDELRDIFGGIATAADVNNGKITNVNDIARQVLEEELKELETSDGDNARIKELRDILKP